MSRIAHRQTKTGDQRSPLRLVKEWFAIDRPLGFGWCLFCGSPRTSTPTMVSYHAFAIDRPIGFRLAGFARVVVGADPYRGLGNFIGFPLMCRGDSRIARTIRCNIFDRPIGFGSRFFFGRSKPLPYRGLGIFFGISLNFCRGRRPRRPAPFVVTFSTDRLVSVGGGLHGSSICEANIAARPLPRLG